MRMLVRPAKRVRSANIIFNSELSDDHLVAVPSGVIVTIVAEPIHRGQLYGDKSRYRYDIELSAADLEKVTETMKRM